MDSAPPEPEPEPRRAQRRRAALVAILQQRADAVAERVVADALRATDFMGLGQSVATRFLGTAERSMPEALNALGADDPDRSRLLESFARHVHELLRLGVPKFVQRALVASGFAIAHGIARAGAREQGFEPNELEDELRVFQRAMEERLFFGA